MTTPFVASVYDGSWSVTDTYSAQQPTNQMLNIAVNSITGGNWLFAMVGWHGVPQLPITVTVGDDAGNYWVPLVTSPAAQAPTVYLLNQNYAFQNGVTTPWTINGGALTVSTTKTLGNNASSGKVVNNGVSNTVSASSGRVSISGFTAGLVSGSAYVWFTNSVSTARVDINWYNSSGTLLSTGVGANNTIPAQTWTNIATLLTPVANAVTASVNVTVTGSPPAAANVWYLSNAGVSQPSILNQNAYFTTTPSTVGWTATGGTVSSSTSQTFNGFPSVHLMPNGTSSQVTLRADTSHLVSVVPNEFYTASGYLFSPAGYDYASAEILWYNSSLTNIQTNLGQNIYLSPNEWSQVNYTGQAPSGAAFASVGVGLFSHPQTWDIAYAAQVTLNHSAGFSSAPRCAIWAAPNIASSTTQVSISPLGQATAMAAVVWQVNNMPSWLTVDSVSASFLDQSSLISLSLTPSQADFVISMAAASLSQKWTTDFEHLNGWNNFSYSSSWATSNNATSEGDLYIKIGALPATSGAATPIFYSVNPLNNNPVFAASVSGYTTTNATVTSVTGFTDPGGFIVDTRLTSNNSAKLTPNGSASANNLYANLATAPAVTAGLSYQVEGYFYSPVGWTSQVLAIQWLNGSRTLLSTAVSANFSMGTSAWGNNAFIAIAPSGAKFATPTFGQNGTPPTSAATYIGRFTLSQVNNNGLGLSHAIAAIQLNPQVPATVNSQWPYVKLEAAFGFASNTPPDQLQYVDISNRLLSFGSGRGRQYELNALQAGTLDFVLRNDDGYLTPSNAQSPYTIQAYTPIRLTAIWLGKVYPIFIGYMERWPEVWTDPHWGEVNAVGVDAWAMFVGIMPSIVKGERLIDGPAGYWPCADGSSSTTAVNIGVMGNSTVLKTTVSPNGPGSAGKAVFGDSTIKLVGDSGTDWALTGLLSSEGSQGFSLTYNGTPLPPINEGVCVAWWMNVPFTGPVTTASRNAIFTATGRRGPIIQVWMDNGTGIHVTTWDVNQNQTDHVPSSAAGWANQTVPMMLNFDNNGYTLYIGNSEILTGTDTMVTFWSQFSFCGETDIYQTGFYTNMAISHVCVFPRQLGFSRLVTYNFTGINGMANDFGDWRVSRYFSYMLWTVAHRIYYDSSTSALASATGIEGQSIGSAIGNVADTERALLYVDKAGYVTYRTRNHILDRGVRATFGENVAAGELPYLIDVQLDYDPQYVYNDTQVTHQGSPQFGQTATSSPVIYVKNLGSVNQYGDRSQQLTSLFNSITQSVDLANWLNNQYSQPRPRVQQVKFTPSRSSSLFSVLLALDVGDRIIFNRRPIGANIVTLDVIIIGVHHDVKFSDGTWTMTFDLMPTSTASLALDSLTMNDAVLGKLDAGNVFNW